MKHLDGIRKPKHLAWWLLLQVSRGLPTVVLHKALLGLVQFQYLS